MIDLLNSTNVYRQMPKELFYKYLNCADTLKKKFIDDIDSIIWVNRLSPDTLSVWPGKILSEIAVVEIVLKRQAISQDLIEIINRETNQYTVFIVRYEAWGQIWCGNNESGQQPSEKLRFDTYYQTSWQLYNDLKLKVEGLDLDHIYANILMQVAGKTISIENTKPPKQEENKKEETAAEAEVKKLEEAINQLQIKIKHEKQFGKQLKLLGELKKTKAEMQKFITLHMSHQENRQPVPKEVAEEPVENIRFLFPHVFVNMKDEDGKPFDMKLY